MIGSCGSGLDCLSVSHYADAIADRDSDAFTLTYRNTVTGAAGLVLRIQRAIHRP